MTPMEAWRIISGNMIQLYNMRKTAFFKGYTEDETEAEVVCFGALQQLERKQAMERKKRTAPLDEKQRQLVRAMADESLSIKRAGKVVGYTYSGSVYALEKIARLTGFDPRNFHDLRELLVLIEGCAEKENDNGT